GATSPPGRGRHGEGRGATARPGHSARDDKPSSLRMDVQPDDPDGPASGTMDVARRRVAFVRQLECEEQGIVALGTAEIQAANGHPTPPNGGSGLKPGTAPVGLFTPGQCRLAHDARE